MNFHNFIFLIYFTSFSVFPQDYDRVDATIQLYPESFENPEDLSKLIVRDFNTDENKVRAMYSWIIRNVSYDPNEYKNFNYTFTNYRDRNQKEEKTREKTIARTLQKGIAVCEGYAMLMEKLCELQGIPNYLVRGDIKSNFDDIGRPFKKSHMWNIITLDKKQYLFDATWGAGKYNGKFIKEPSYFWFQSSPELFLKTHYPEVIEDALVEKPMSRQAFSEMPLLIEKNLLLSELNTPQNGILYAENYLGEISFDIKNVTPKTISYSFGNEKTIIENTERTKTNLKFTIPLQPNAEILLIYFDEKPALGYRIE